MSEGINQLLPNPGRFYFLLRFILTQMSYISFLSSECPTFKSLILPPGLEYSTSTVCIPHKNVWCPVAQGNLVMRDIYNDSIFPSFSPSLPLFLPFIFPPLFPPSFLYSLSFFLRQILTVGLVLILRSPSPMYQVLGVGYHTQLEKILISHHVLPQWL